MEEMKTKLKENRKEEILEENDFINDCIELNDSIKDLSTTNSFDKSQNGLITIKSFNIYFYLNLNKDNIFIFKIRTDFFDINSQ